MSARDAGNRFVPLAAILFVLAIAVGPARAETVAGVIPGDLSVGADGQASYTIPIAVPPGIAGVEPNLALSYGSGGGNGIAGVGWRISGLSAIERCHRTLAQDGAWGGIEYGPDDRLCLGGNRLVAINGVYGADGTEYRTEIDGFARIVSYGRVTSQSGVFGFSPREFRVWTRSGWILEFGTTEDSRVEAVRAVAAGPDIPVEIRRWALSRIADAAGNYLTVSYFEDMAAGAHRVERIDYTANDAAPVAAQSSVRFVYEPRPDVRRNYPDGSRATLDVRLKAIQTYTDGAPVRDYRLAYETGAATGRSRLVSVTACDGTGMAADCLMPHTFEWQQETPGFTSVAGYKVPFTAPEIVDDFDDGTFVDLNGDGREDFVAAVDDGGGYIDPVSGRFVNLGIEVDYQKAWLNTGAGWEPSAAYQPGFFVTAKKNTPMARQQGEFVDVNGDGLKDFVRAVRSRQRTTWLNTGSGWVESPAYQPPFDIFISYDRTFHSCPDYPREPCSVSAVHYYDARMGDFVDLNGDGLLDFVQAVQIEEADQTARPDRMWRNATYLNAWINTGSGWTLSPEFLPPTVLRRYYSRKVVECGGSEQDCTTYYDQISGGGATLADVDGDNLPDYVESWRTFRSARPVDYRTTWLNTGAGWAPSAAYAAPVELWVHDGPNAYQGGRLADVNGDGLVDVVQAGARGGQIQQATWVNTGDGWVEDPTYKPSYVLYSAGTTPRQFHWAGKMRRVTTGTELFDVNGDGLPDAVWSRQSGGSEHETWLNTGNGWRLDASYRPPFGPSSEYSSVNATIDVNGDGAADIVRFGRQPDGNEWSEPTNRETWLANSVEPDRLLMVTDSLGRRATLVYAPLTDPGIYEKHADAAYPVRDVQTPQHVVAELLRDDGVGGLYRTRYRYAGAKIDLTGRSVGAGMANLPNANDGSSDLDNVHVGGAAAQYTFDWGTPPSGMPGSLGFGAVWATDLQTGIVTARRHSQSFPFIGWADIAASYFPDSSGTTDGTLIERTTHTFAAEGLHWAGDPARPRTVFPYVAQTVAERAEPNDGPGNAAIVTETTTREYGDGFGNPKLVTTITQGGGETFTASISRQFANDTAGWFIGRLMRAEETRTLPDSRSATRVRAYDWDFLGTGMLKQVIVEPDRPDLYLQTDYERDVFGHLKTTTVSGP
ncbi:MAG: VCBS repeat-containing protein, partial [Rhodospirillales bacterium]